MHQVVMGSWALNIEVGSLPTDLYDWYLQNSLLTDEIDLEAPRHGNPLFVAAHAFNRTQRALMHQARAERIINASLASMQPEIAETVSNMVSGVELSSREQLQAYYYMRIQVAVVEDALWQLRRRPHPVCNRKLPD